MLSRLHCVRQGLPYDYKTVHGIALFLDFQYPNGKFDQRRDFEWKLDLIEYRTTRCEAIGGIRDRRLAPLQFFALVDLASMAPWGESCPCCKINDGVK